MSGLVTGLDPSDVVSMSVTIEPNALPTTNFGIALAIGYSTVIDVGERSRTYSSLPAVAADFGTTAPEYLAAKNFFSQAPQPAQLSIGRWAKTATAGRLRGAQFSAAQQAAMLTALAAITTGSMTISVDGTPHALSALNFSSAGNMSAVAGIIATALTQATVVWDSVYGRFVITSKTTGTSSAVTYAAPTGTGTDVSAILGLTAASGASAPVAGIAAETPVACLQAFSRYVYYGASFALALQSDIADADFIAAAAYMEATQRIFGITITSPQAIDPTNVSDLASNLAALKLTRTCTQYCSSDCNAIFSLIGRAFTVDYTAQNSTLTLKFKQEPGIVAEVLNETQAAALTAKNVNVFVTYSNGAQIIQQGVMCSGLFFDIRVGVDWQANDVQTSLFNALYTSPTKIPQTDAGVHQLLTVVEASMDRGVYNGLTAPGVWTSELEFGTLSTGDTLAKGYYVYVMPISQQAQADRAARKCPPFQIAMKLAGAIHDADAAIYVNQ